MPLRSVKMKRFIFGFQRRVWWPKWTPLSSSWRIVTTAMVLPSVFGCRGDRVAAALPPPASRPPLDDSSQDLPAAPRPIDDPSGLVACVVDPPKQDAGDSLRRIH